jgi:hypothetical protein
VRKHKFKDDLNIKPKYRYMKYRCRYSEPVLIAQPDITVMSIGIEDSGDKEEEEEEILIGCPVPGTGTSD